jgi:hypothetical protein
MMSSAPLTAEEIAVIRGRIVKLEAQYDKIISGTSVVEFVDQNGEKVRYSAANAANLLAHINRLKAMIDPCFANRYKSRPVGFIFR